MKKIINVNSIVFLIIGLIFGAFTAYADTTSYSSGQVLYKDSSNKKHVLTETINDIYSKINFGDATADDIAKGKTALVQGKEVTGTGRSYMNYNKVMVANNVTSGTVDISSICTDNNLDCSKLTSDSFYMEVTSITKQAYNSGWGNYRTGGSDVARTLTYNAATSKLTYDAGSKWFQNTVGSTNSVYIADYCIYTRGTWGCESQDFTHYSGDTYFVEKVTPKVNIYLIKETEEYDKILISSNVTSGVINLNQFCQTNGINCSKLTNEMFVMDEISLGNSIYYSGQSGVQNPPVVPKSIYYEPYTGDLTYNTGNLINSGDSFCPSNADAVWSNYGRYVNGSFQVDYSDGTRRGGCFTFTEKILPKANLYLIVK